MSYLAVTCFKIISKLHIFTVYEKEAIVSKLSTEKVFYQLMHDSATWKAATGRNCNIKSTQQKKAAWIQCNMEIVKQEKSATWKKCNMERIEHEKFFEKWKKMQHKNVKHECKTKRVEKVKHKETWKVKRNSDTLIECNTKEVQNEKKCSTKETWKVKEIAKHERIAIRETCNMERLQHEEVLHEERATRKELNLKRVQQGKSATWK